MSILGILVVLGFAVFLLTIGASSSFWLCLGEIVIFSFLLALHVKGNFIIARFIFFIFAMVTQVYGSLYHGENGGFDFLFFATALAPVLFFEKKLHYASLFVLSLSTYIAVKVMYDYTDPVLPVERQVVPYYMNIVISSLLIYLGYVLFKSGHLKYERQLKGQRDQIQQQKDAIVAAQEQMTQLLDAHTKRLQEQSQDIMKYAYLNAHKTRSPLARILGLVNLAKHEDLDEEDKRRYYFEEIHTNAKELDETLREINEVLNKNPGS